MHPISSVLTSQSSIATAGTAGTATCDRGHIFGDSHTKSFTDETRLRGKFGTMRTIDFLLMENLRFYLQIRSIPNKASAP